MLRSIFLKTLYEKRMYTLFWSIGMFLMVLLTMSIYPSFAQDGGLIDAFANVPEALKGIIGDLAAQKTIPGFIDQQILAFRMPLFMIIFSIILFNSLIAGDESEGTLQTLLVQPVSRLRALLEKLSAGLVLTALASLATALGILAGLGMIGESFSLVRLLAATFNLWLMSVCFGMFVLTIGAITGKKGLASGIASLFAFANYFITSLAPSVKSLQPFEKFTLIHYYNEPQVAVHGFDGMALLLLGAFCIILLAAGAIVFNKRDVYQR
jgi:ABC-2 type transport system permease protein